MKSKYPLTDYLKGFWYSLPLQLLFLHFRKYQVLLLCWFLLFAIVNGSFMRSFGSESLFLSPEYLGDVNALGTAIVGMSLGILIMCWNITTFILFSRHFTFLAATQFPFLKYCINNAVIPLGFLIFYFIRAYQFAHYKELIPNIEILILLTGFLAGLILVLSISFFYFFRADKTILKRLQPAFKTARNYLAKRQPQQIADNPNALLRSEWFLDSFLQVRRCRDVSHYSSELMEKIFKQHHFAAVLSLLIAYAFLIIIGSFLDNRFFQLPAGASITLFISILIGVIGALVYFFRSWSVPALLLFLFLLNLFYTSGWIDPRNKAYGLDYNPAIAVPKYNRESLEAQGSSEAVLADIKNMEGILDRWKARQGEEKPLLYLITTSGGGTRSATFTLNVLQELDSISGGSILQKTFLITGASGGMIGATYFRELYRQRSNKVALNLQSQEYVDNIANDLLNPIFTSFIARDLFAPERKFTLGTNTYLRDRGYAFERALDNNTGGVLNKQLKHYYEDELQARIPLMFYHNVITRDAKMLFISTQPLRFMMYPPGQQPGSTPDGVDFKTFFAGHSPMDLRLLSALRMNATFPVVLPNVWLPSEPVMDVMDGGLRDNYGVSTSLRFLSHMESWIKANTRGVVVIQIRDRMDGGWEHPYEYDNLTGNAVKPLFLLQNNWYKMMEYFQGDMDAYYAADQDYPVHKITFQYIPRKEEDKAALSFHLTQREKLDITSSIHSKRNLESFKRLQTFLQSGNKQPETLVNKVNPQN